MPKINNFHSQGRTWVGIIVLLCGIAAVGVLLCGKFGNSWEKEVRPNVLAASEIHKKNSDHGLIATKKGKAQAGKQISQERKVEAISAALVGMSYPYEKEKLRDKLDSEISAILKLSDKTEREQLLGQLAESFIVQFTSERGDAKSLVMALRVYEETIKNHESQIKSTSLAYQSLLENLVPLFEFKPDDALSRENALLAEYDLRKSDLIGKIAGVVVAQRLEALGVGALDEIKNLERNEVRSQTERSVLKDLAKSNTPDSLEAFKYYFSGDSNLKAEKPLTVDMISVGFTAYPEEISDIVFNAAKGPKRDAAIVQMVLRMKRTDPEATQQWIDQISDTSLREYAKNDFNTNDSLMMRLLPEPSGKPDPFADSSTH